MIIYTLNACAELQNLKRAKKVQVKPGKFETLRSLEDRGVLGQNTTYFVTLRGLSI